MVKKILLKQTNKSAIDDRAWRLFGSLLSFISADIGMFKSKEKPKFAPHVVRSLLSLAHRTDATSLSALAQILGVSLPRASRICEDLVKEGFVTRDRSEHDRREVMLHLTNEANKFNASLWKERKPPLAATMEEFSEEEIQIIERFLQSLAQNYRESIQESENPQP
ncbi:MAG: MarR family transcriptional regulator [Candidatus Obscuribacterales bacterium]|nr:MarR family transcriptional regulator [Candidatus Obscuribacterales bacterium]